MCGSRADIQSAVVEIRRGKKERKIDTTWQKYKWPALLHRAAITKLVRLQQHKRSGLLYCWGHLPRACLKSKYHIAQMLQQQLHPLSKVLESFQLNNDGRLILCGRWMCLQQQTTISFIQTSTLLNVILKAHMSITNMSNRLLQQTQQLCKW